VQDDYQIPAFVLTLLLLPGLGYLAARFRDRRAMLWCVGLALSVVRMAQHYQGLIFWNFSNEYAHPWIATLGMVSAQIGSVLFVMSLAPAHISVGRFRLQLPLLYTLPIVVYSVLYMGVLRQQTPHGWMAAVFPALALCSSAIALLWALRLVEQSQVLRNGVLIFTIILTLRAMSVYIIFGPGWLLSYFEFAAHFMTVLLLILAARRLSPGSTLGALGFAAWGISMISKYPFVVPYPELVLVIHRCVVMGKVVAALGLILLALEDQLAINQAAAARERRARRELEAYAGIAFSSNRVEALDQEAGEACRLVTEYSRFSRAALLLQKPDGHYRLCGSAGIDGATASALDAMAGRINTTEFLLAGAPQERLFHSETMRVNFEPWLVPGDDLRSLRFTSALAVPLRAQTVTEGALLLDGMRGGEPLVVDDLLPAEILTARLQAVRGRTRMQEQLIDAEKYAVLGQLAGNVSQQLNNPLTVILGYASLLAEATGLDVAGHKGAETILSAARSMRSTLESLERVVRTRSGPFTAVSVAELLADVEQLYRTEFQKRSIEFRLSVAPNLPLVICQPQSLRQAVLHSLQFAMKAVENGSHNGRSVRLEATSEGNHVQILVAHSGAGFEHPGRAFDPMAAGQSAGLGLSLCASILHNNNGRASAVNLDPQGAAILLELQVERRRS
jgi:signal transduction histidine kinase